MWARVDAKSRLCCKCLLVILNEVKDQSPTAHVYVYIIYLRLILHFAQYRPNKGMTGEMFGKQTQLRIVILSEAKNLEMSETLLLRVKLISWIHF
jgi:hypothetical protein